MAYTTINKSEDYFKAILFTGTHASVPTITVGWKSDFLWLKSRTQTYDHNLLDTTRGGTSKLASNNTNSASTTGDSVTFNSTSFEPSGQAINESGQGTNNMISWSWKANGGSQTTNNDGTAASYVQVNSTSGMSIIKFTGGGSTAYTLGHGLGAIPSFFIAKNYSSTSGWYGMFPKFWGGNQSSGINTTNAFGTVSGFTGFTTSVFEEGQNDSDNYIAYAWIPIKGYSAFGTYVSNNNADGPKIFTGFKPAFVILKMNSAGTNWRMYDSKREGFNPENNFLLANGQGAENTATNSEIEFHSNGFKCTNAEGDINYNTERVLYAAWADKPSCFSDGVPTTAF